MNNRVGTFPQAAAGLTSIFLLMSSLVATAEAQFVEPDASVLQLFEGDSAGDYFGWVCEKIGDLDGDGASELLIPAILDPTGGPSAGRISVYSGASGALLHRIDGQAGSVLGYSVNAAGDVNADGFPDYVVGGGQTLVLSGVDHSVIHDLTAAVGFATGVSGAGDVDGDGYGDVFVGSQGNSTSAPQAGRVFLFSGFDGSLLWTRDGGAGGDGLGSAVGVVGDVNRDWVPDLVAGAFNAGPQGGGEAYVLSGVDGSLIHTLEPEDPATASVFGQFFASGAGDVNGDRVGDIYVGDYNDALGGTPGTGRGYVFSGRTGRRIHLFNGIDPGEGFGPGRSAGDVNGDGFADLIIGAYTNSDGGAAAGKAYLYSGRSGALLRTVSATLAGDNFGVDAISAGDVNGDGRADYLVTAVGLSFAGTDVGRAYLIEGTALPCTSDIDGNRWVGLRDLLKVLAAFGASGGPEDVNGDGTVDPLDFKVVLRDLGRCPAG